MWKRLRFYLMVWKLQSRRWYDRKAAIQVLGELRDTAAVAHLFPLLADPMKVVRETVVEALLQLGLDDHIAQVAQMTNDQRPQVRRAVAALLGRLADEQHAGLVLGMAARDPDSEVRCAAEEAFVAINSPRAIELIRKAIDPNNKQGRLVAIRVLGRLKNLHAISGLIRLLSSADSETRLASATALVDLGWNHGKLTLKTAKTPKGSEIERLLRSEQLPSELVVGMLADSDCLIRREAILGLVNLRNARWIPSLGKALSDSHKGNRLLAAQALANLQDFDRLLAVSLDANHPDHEEMIDLLANVGHPVVIATLRESLRSADPSQRVRSIETLVHLEPEEMGRPLLQLASDPVEIVRSKVVQSLRSINVDAAINILTEMYKDPSPRIRKDVVFTLAEIAGVRALDVVVQAMDDPEEEVQCEAANAMCTLDDPVVAPQLLSRITCDSAYVSKVVIGRLSSWHDSSVTVLLVNEYQQCRATFEAMFIQILRHHPLPTLRPLIKRMLGSERMGVVRKGIRMAKDLRVVSLSTMLVGTFSRVSSELATLVGEAIVSFGDREIAPYLREAVPFVSTHAKKVIHQTLEQLGATRPIIPKTAQTVSSPCPTCRGSGVVECECGGTGRLPTPRVLPQGYRIGVHNRCDCKTGLLKCYDCGGTGNKLHTAQPAAKPSGPDHLAALAECGLFPLGKVIECALDPLTPERHVYVSVLECFDGVEPHDALVKLLGDQNAEIRERATQSLRWSPSKKTLTRLTELLTCDDDLIASSALLSLSQLHPSRIQALLPAAIRNSSAAMRLAAVSLFPRFDEHAGEALIEAVKRESVDEVRAAEVDALRESRFPCDTATIDELLATQADRTVSATLAYIKEVDDRRSIPALRRLVKVKSWQSQTASILLNFGETQDVINVLHDAMSLASGVEPGQHELLERILKEFPDRLPTELLLRISSLADEEYEDQEFEWVNDMDYGYYYPVQRTRSLEYLRSPALNELRRRGSA